MNRGLIVRHCMRVHGPNNTRLRNENHIEGNKGIAHPERPLALLLPDPREQHPVVGREIFPEHQSAAAIRLGYREFNFKGVPLAVDCHNLKPLRSFSTPGSSRKRDQKKQGSEERTKKIRGGHRRLAPVGLV